MRFHLKTSSVHKLNPANVGVSVVVLSPVLLEVATRGQQQFNVEPETTNRAAVLLLGRLSGAAHQPVILHGLRGSFNYDTFIY